MPPYSCPYIKEDRFSCGYLNRQSCRRQVLPRLPSLFACSPFPSLQAWLFRPAVPYGISYAGLRTGKKFSSSNSEANAALIKHVKRERGASATSKSHLVFEGSSPCAFQKIGIKDRRFHRDMYRRAKPPVSIPFGAFELHWDDRSAKEPFTLLACRYSTSVLQIRGGTPAFDRRRKTGSCPLLPLFSAETASVYILCSK